MSLRKSSLLIALLVGSISPVSAQPARPDPAHSAHAWRAMNCLLEARRQGASPDAVCDLILQGSTPNPAADYAGPPPDVVHAGNAGRTGSSVTLCDGASPLRASSGCPDDRR